ncbi:conjugal transfer protein [Streptococcus gallolyticus]|nr:conjugal transfer protein [Streptococcus gallolyticus]MBY5040681.1 conjugal transfer protein [Streptococcus gallolyticus]
MSEAGKRVDKKLYSYKEALSQPVWVQKITERFSFTNPIRLSAFVYFFLFFGLFWFLLEALVGFFSMGLRGVLSVFFSLQLTIFVNGLVIDGKAILPYVRDYLSFYLVHGINAGKVYINKGQIYVKPKNQIRIKKGEK